MGKGRQSNWFKTDFVDQEAVSPAPVESDPWEPDHRDPNLIDPPPYPDRPAATDLPDPTEPVEEPDRWDVLDLVDDARLESSDQTVEPSDWDEPDPTVQASSELSESLYPPDNSITDISRHLRMGQLLANVYPITEEQKARCLGLLKAWSLRRLRRVLPWLYARRWSGRKLQLFLEFHRHWESQANSRWWETFHWNARDQQWDPRYVAGTLTLDHLRELVDRRSHCGMADLIDGSWFADWENHSAWELGVRSFASFAVFRAGIGDGRVCCGKGRNDTLRILSSLFSPSVLPVHEDVPPPEG